MLGLQKGFVKLMPYNKNWAKQFETEKKYLCTLLRDYEVQIEHVGSTSIPGLSAKPVIDLAIGVKTEEDLKAVSSVLAEAGYYVKERRDADHQFITNEKNSSGFKTHHIHVEIIGKYWWKSHILFKRYLLEHPKYIKEYENLKIKLAQQFFGNGKSYSAAKDNFIQTIIKKAEILYEKENN